MVYKHLYKGLLKPWLFTLLMWCTAAGGVDPSMTPTEVQVLSVASTSAVVGWLPADSALEHRVVVDDVARVVIRPGGYRCTVTGNKSSQSPGLAS